MNTGSDTRSFLTLKCMIMESIKIMATVEGTLLEIEAKQTDPNHPDFKLLQNGREMGHIHKENGHWFADEDCLLRDDIHTIGRTIDEHLNKRF